MKNLIRKLAPGVVVSALALACIGWLSAQTSTVAPVQTVQAPQPVNTAAPQYFQPAPPPMTLCGSCNAQLQAPQVVMIAAPVAGSVHVRSYGAQAYGRPVYVEDCAPVYIPPQPIFAGYNHGRAPVYYPRSSCGHNHHHGHGCR